MNDRFFRSGPALQSSLVKTTDQEIGFAVKLTTIQMPLPTPSCFGPLVVDASGDGVPPSRNEVCPKDQLWLNILVQDN